MEANEPAWILATSGTTAKPKLAIHTHGGYQVHVVSMGRWCFGLTPADVWWATSDIGWIVGHSYMVYAPLLIGCTTVVFEGALDHPQPEGNWRAAVEEFGVTGIFTSPTAVRMLMRYGDEPLLRVDHSRLERVVCAGEVLNAPAWDWLQNRILKNRMPVIDHMWQTETGGPVFGNPYGIGLLPIKPGSATIPLPGIEAAVVTLDGEVVRAERERDHGDQPAVPRADAGALGRARAVRARLLAEDSRRLLHRRLRARRRGRLRVVRRARRRDHQDRGAPHRHHRSRERVPEAPVGGRMRRHRPARRDARRGDLGVRPAQARARGVGRPAHARSSTRSGASWARWRSSAS